MRHPHGLRAAAGRKIEFVASAQSQTPLAATLVINKPTDTQQGDLMIAIVCADSGVTWTQPSGWSKVLDQGVGTGIMVSHYIAGASEPSSYTFTTGGNRRLSGIIVTYRNAAYDVVGSISTLSNQIAPAITLAQSGSTLLAFFASNSTRTWSSPTGGLISLAFDSDGTPPSWALYSQANVASGSTGTRSATSTSSPGSLGCLLVGIKPS